MPRTLSKDRSAFGPFRERLAGVNAIWLCGPSVLNVFLPNSSLLIHMIRQGVELRVLIFDPEGEHLPIFAEQLRTPPDQVMREIKTVIGLCEDLVDSGLGVGSLELRLTSMMPGFSMVIFNPEIQNGQMVVEYIGYRSRLDDRPHFDLDSANDRQWFDYYINQFNKLWSAATPYAFEEPSQKLEDTFKR